MTEGTAAEPLLLRPIGVVRSPFRTKNDVPKGLGALHDEEGRLEILPELAAGLADIEGFSHLYVLWIFDRAGAYELVGRNPTDGLQHGVFATRSPDRPNPIGLHRVSVLQIAGPRLRVAPLEAIDGTPIIDLKPVLTRLQDR